MSVHGTIISMAKQGMFSVAKAILAVLWKRERADTRLLLNHRYLHELCARHNKATFRTAMFRLLKTDLVDKRSEVYHLTDKGKTKAGQAFVEAEIRLYSPEKEWDGGWRIVLFDVPEAQRLKRDYLRKIIKNLGFKEFQKSIWVYPYPVPAFLKEIFAKDGLGKYAKFLTTESIENDEELRSLFSLPQNRNIA